MKKGGILKISSILMILLASILLAFSQQSYTSIRDSIVQSHIELTNLFTGYLHFIRDDILKNTMTTGQLTDSIKMHFDLIEQHFLIHQVTWIIGIQNLGEKAHFEGWKDGVNMIKSELESDDLRATGVWIEWLSDERCELHYRPTGAGYQQNIVIPQRSESGADYSHHLDAIADELREQNIIRREEISDRKWDELVERWKNIWLD